MRFSFKDSIPFSREQVFETQRDHLAELAPYLNEIDTITVMEREDEGSVTRLVNEWKATGQDIPKAARGFIKPEMLRWTDYATWKQEEWKCEWRSVLGFLPDVIECKGSTWFAESGSRTTVTVAGEILVHADKIPGVPRFAAGKLGGAVEKFVVGLIKPNLSKTNEGVTRYLRDQEA